MFLQLFSRIQDLSDECEHIAVGENTMAVIDGMESVSWVALCLITPN